MKRLGIDLDSILRLREWGGGAMPDPVQIVSALEMAGADSIVYSARGGNSVYEERDLAILHHCIHSHFNLRIEPSDAMIQAAVKSRPGMVTFTVFKGGKAASIDLTAQEERLFPQINHLRQKGIIVNALVDPDAEQLKTAVRLHFDYIELHTRRYVNADTITAMEQELENMKALAMTAAKFNLSVMAGGDMDVGQIRGIRMINEIEEVNIGQPLFNRSLFVGLHQAVKDFTEALQAEK